MILGILHYIIFLHQRASITRPALMPHPGSSSQEDIFSVASSARNIMEGEQGLKGFCTTERYRNCGPQASWIAPANTCCEPLFVSVWAGWESKSLICKPSHPTKMISTSQHHGPSSSPWILGRLPSQQVPLTLIINGYMTFTTQQPYRYGTWTWLSIRGGTDGFSPLLFIETLIQYLCPSTEKIGR